MIIVMENGASDAQIEGVVKKIKEFGLESNVSRGTERTVIGAIGDERKLDQEMIDALSGVESSMHIVKPYKIIRMVLKILAPLILIGLDRLRRDNKNMLRARL